MHRFLVLCLAVVSGALLAPRAVAQEHFPVSTEASFGPTMTHGGMYSTGPGAAVDVVLGYGLRDTSVGTLIGALNAGVQFPVSPSGCPLDPGGDCSPEFPAVISGGPLLGIQRGSARTASARILAGPTYYHALEEGRAPRASGPSRCFHAPRAAHCRGRITAALRAAQLPGRGARDYLLRPRAAHPVVL
jgi:hypothetical protein